MEYVAICLIKIVERVSQSSELLDELCKHELIHQVIHLIDLNSRITISQPIYKVGKCFVILLLKPAFHILLLARSDLTFSFWFGRV